VQLRWERGSKGGVAFVNCSAAFFEVITFVFSICGSFQILRVRTS